MNITQAFPSSTLKAADIEDEDLILTMSHVEIKTVGQGNKAEDKPHLYFKETDKALVLNKTNAASISKLYGPDTDDWAGQKISLFSTEVDFAGTPTLAIRVRLKKPTGATAPAKASTATAPAGKPDKAVLAARSAAWQAFIDKTPDFDEAKRKTKWTDAIKTIFPTKAERELTVEDWTDFKAQVVKEYDQGFEDFCPI